MSTIDELNSDLGRAHLRVERARLETQKAMTLLEISTSEKAWIDANRDAAGCMASLAVGYFLDGQQANADQWRAKADATAEFVSMSERQMNTFMASMNEGNPDA